MANGLKMKKVIGMIDVALGFIVVIDGEEA